MLSHNNIKGHLLCFSESHRTINRRFSISPSKDFSGVLSCISDLEESELLFGTISKWRGSGCGRCVVQTVPLPHPLPDPFSFWRPPFRPFFGCEILSIVAQFPCMYYLFPLPPPLRLPLMLPGSRPAVPPPSAIRELKHP